MASIFAAARLLGASMIVAYGLQFLVAVIVAGAVFSVIRRRPGGSAEGAAIAAAIPVCTPYLLRYDMVILAVPLAWLWAEGSRAGFLPAERTILCVCFVSTSLTTLRIDGVEVLVAPIVALAVFLSVIRRCMIRIRTGGALAMPVE
jgi:hypothetical protein